MVPFRRSKPIPFFKAWSEDMTQIFGEERLSGSPVLDSCQRPKLPSRCHLVSHSPGCTTLSLGSLNHPAQTRSGLPLNPITASSSSALLPQATSSLGEVWVSIIWRLRSLSSPALQKVQRLLVVMVTDFCLAR